MGNQAKFTRMNLDELAGRMSERIEFLRRSEVRMAVDVISLAISDFAVQGIAPRIKNFGSMEFELLEPRTYKFADGDVRIGYRYRTRWKMYNPILMKSIYQFYSEEEVSEGPVCAKTIPKLKRRAYYYYSLATDTETLRITNEEGEFVPRTRNHRNILLRRAALKELHEERANRSRENLL